MGKSVEGQGQQHIEFEKMAPLRKVISNEKKYSIFYDSRE